MLIMSRTGTLETWVIASEISPTVDTESSNLPFGHWDKTLFKKKWYDFLSKYDYTLRGKQSIIWVGQKETISVSDSAAFTTCLY